MDRICRECTSLGRNCGKHQKNSIGWTKRPRSYRCWRLRGRTLHRREGGPRRPSRVRAGIKTAIRACAPDADHYGSLPPPKGSLCPRKHINEIRRFELFTDGRSAQVALTKPDLIIERSRLIRRWPARPASRCRTILRYAFLGIGPYARPCGSRWNPAASQKSCTRTAWSRGRRGEPLARASGWPAIETVPLVQAIVRLPKDCPPDTTRVWFVRMIAYFYC